jgi:hypothetical protein
MPLDHLPMIKSRGRPRRLRIPNEGFSLARRVELIHLAAQGT